MRNSTLQHSDMGNLNRATILNLIRENGPISRADLVKSTNLTGPTVSRIVQNLINEDLVSEVGIGESVGGRKPILLVFRPIGRIVMGIDVRPEMITGLICDLDGNIISEDKEDLDPKMSSNEVMEVIKDYAEELIRSSKIPRRSLAGIGVSIPGLVENYTNNIRFSPPSGWRNLSLKGPLSDHLGVPVMVGNTVEVLTLGEKFLGNKISKFTNNLVYLYVGSGIGAGVVVNGSFFRGSRFSGVELGHNTIDLHGPKCRCGNYGCFEALANNSALLQEVNRRLEETGELPVQSIDQVAQLINEGRKEAFAALQQMAVYLGVGVANIINTFNPDVIVLGGWPSYFEELVFPDIEHVAKTRSLEGMSEGVHLLSSQMGEKGVVLGAASLIIEGFLKGELPTSIKERM